MEDDLIQWVNWCSTYMKLIRFNMSMSKRMIARAEEENLFQNILPYILTGHHFLRCIVHCHVYGLFIYRAWNDVGRGKMLNPGKISQEMCFEPHVVVSLKSILFLIGVADYVLSWCYWSLKVVSFALFSLLVAGVMVCRFCNNGWCMGDGHECFCHRTLKNSYLILIIYSRKGHTIIAIWADLYLYTIHL